MVEKKLALNLWSNKKNLVPSLTTCLSKWQIHFSRAYTAFLRLMALLSAAKKLRWVWLFIIVCLKVVLINCSHGHMKRELVFWNCSGWTWNQNLGVGTGSLRSFLKQAILWFYKYPQKNELKPVLFVVLCLQHVTTAQKEAVSPHLVCSEVIFFFSSKVFNRLSFHWWHLTVTVMAEIQTADAWGQLCSFTTTKNCLHI